MNRDSFGLWSGLVSGFGEKRNWKVTVEGTVIETNEFLDISKNEWFAKLKFKTLFTWSGGPRSSGVGFVCFHALGDTKQKKPNPLDQGSPLHVNRP